MSNPRSAAGSWCVWPVLATLPLLVSCSDKPASESPVAPPTPISAQHAPGATSVFIDEPAVMDVPTYDGSGQSVHPDVVAFDTPWHGARYWLTMTPYPKSNQTLENPSILLSANGTTVVTPPGLRNPVIQAPKHAKDYNSDPELLYEPQTDRLVLFYRLVDKKANTVHVSTSRDGSTWTPVRAPFWERSHQVVSPTVAPGTNGPAHMWYVNAGKAGCETKSTRVVMRTATDTTGRIVDTRWRNSVPTDLSIPGYAIWHIKARWIPSKAEYWMLISAFPLNANGCHTDDLFFARSSDGLHWTTYTQPVLRHEEHQWTAAAVYRSSFIYDAARDELRLWISARGADGAWHIGYGRAHFTAMLHALETDQRLTTAPRVFFTTGVSTAGEQP